MLTHPVSDNKKPPTVSTGYDRRTGNPCILSVLCVYEDPRFLDRIRRNLEPGGDMFVEISVSVEDALLLMGYLFFDVIVTDCIAWHGEQNGFLNAMRKQETEIPVIYFIRGLMTGSIKDARQDGRVRYLVWGERDSTPPFDELVRCIREIAAPGLEREARNAFGWPRMSGERIV